MWVTLDDIERIAQFLKLDKDFFTSHYIRRIQTRYSLCDSYKQECIFWSSSGCKIYDVRPKQCRTFPNWDKSKTIDPKAIEAMKLDCPGIKAMDTKS